MLYRFQIVRAYARISPLISIPAKRDIVSENFIGIRNNREKRRDLLIPKDQYSIIVNFNTGLDILRDRIAIDIGVV